MLALLLVQIALPKTPVAITATAATGAAIQVPNKKAKATVLLFVTPECPITNRLAPELTRITTAYTKKQVTFFLVYADRDTTSKQTQKHQKDFSLTPTALLDPTHKLVKATGATVTPEAVILLPTGKLAYRGRINDLFTDHGQQQAKAKSNDVKRALDEILANKPVSRPLVPAIGCSIPK